MRKLTKNSFCCVLVWAIETNENEKNFGQILYHACCQDVKEVGLIFLFLVQFFQVEVWRGGGDVRIWMNNVVMFFQMLFIVSDLFATPICFRSSPFLKH